MSDRSMQPTAKRRKEAREQGRVVVSSQIPAMLSWVLVSYLCLTWSQRGLMFVRVLFEELWLEQHAMTGVDLLQQSAVLFAKMSAPMLGLIFLAIALGRVAQTGFVWAPQRAFSADRLNPSRQLGEMFKAEKLIQLARSLGLIATMLGIAAWGIWHERETIARLAFSSHLEKDAMQLLATWGLRMGGCMVVFAILDYFYQYQRFEQSLHMSPEEVRAEVKAVEGNPQVAASRRNTHHQIREQSQRHSETD